jgi:hypothetical protein
MVIEPFKPGLPSSVATFFLPTFIGYGLFAVIFPAVSSDERRLEVIKLTGIRSSF